MTPERWRQIGDLFDVAARLEPAQREGWLRRACGEDREAGDWRHADEPQEARRDATPLSGRIDARHRHGEDRQGKQRTGDRERGKTVRTQGSQHHLATRRSGEIGDLIERVERAPIGIGRPGVDPGFDRRVKPGEENAG